MRMTDRVAERACGTADERDDVERVTPCLISAFAEVDDQLPPTRNRRYFR
jgi:hypothetical protein